MAISELSVDSDISDRAYLDYSDMGVADDNWRNDDGSTAHQLLEFVGGGDVVES